MMTISSFMSNVTTPEVSTAASLCIGIVLMSDSLGVLTNGFLFHRFGQVKKR
jgi:hypothetical protein